MNGVYFRGGAGGTGQRVMERAGVPREMARAAVRNIAGPGAVNQGRGTRGAAGGRTRARRG